MFRRDVLPHLPADRASHILDLGCGQGQLVKLMLEHGYSKARGIDISPEQVQLAHSAGITTVELGDFRKSLGESTLDAITATDFLEHLTREEILQALDHVKRTLRPGGVFIARVPNAVSPFGGNYRHGDLTHETSFTARSLRQLGAAVGLPAVDICPCPPAVHGTKSLARSAVWKCASGAFKLALAAETGIARGHFVTQNIVATMRAAP